MRRTAATLLAGVAALALGACDDGSGEGAPPGTPSVLATTPVLASLVQPLLDGRTVRTLVPPGADPHDYRFNELDLDAASDADLVVANGGGLEPDLSALREHADPDAVLVAVSHLAEPVETRGGGVDAHFWHDPLEAAAVVQAVADRLARLDPERADAYAARAQQAGARLRGLRRELDGLLEAVPRSRRALVTQHEFFRYFARRFGFTVLGTVVPGPSPVGEAAPSGRGELVEAMNQRDVCAVFVLASSGETLSALVAEEVEREVVVVPVFADTFGGEVDGYDDMMRRNAHTLARTLTACR